MDKLNENLLLLILAAVNFTHIMDFVVMAPLSPILRDELSISTKEFGFLLASYTLSAAVAGIVGSFFLDKFDFKTFKKEEKKQKIIEDRK